MVLELYHLRPHHSSPWGDPAEKRIFGFVFSVIVSQILHGTYLMLKKKVIVVFLFAKYCSLGLGP